MNSKKHPIRLFIVTTSLLIIFIFSFNFDFQQDENLILVKIKVSDTEIIEDLEVDPNAVALIRRIRSYDFHFVSNISPGFLWAIVSENDIIFLHERGFEVERILKAPDTELYKRMVWGPGMTLPEGYHTYDEIVEELESLHDLYPDITEIRVIGKTQRFNRDIYAIKLSGNAGADDEKPAVLFSAAIHSNEIMGAEVSMALLRELLEGYGKIDEINTYVESLEIWFVPVINVDGYQIATTLHPMWRKNLRDNDGDGMFSLSDGVDLNRNFDFNWQTSGNSDPASKFYKGSMPFSESETVALARFVKEQKFLFSFTYHSAESRVYYPWYSGPDRQIVAPEDDLLTGIANNIANRIRTINEDYTYQAVRNTRLDSYTTNYYYGVLGTIDFMIELGKYDHAYSQSILENIIEHNLPGALYILNRALGPGISGKVTDSETGMPVSAEVRILRYDNADINPRTTDRETGRYFRALNPGTYDVLFTGEGKESNLLTGVKVDDFGWTVLDIKLTNK